jgi:hypothetical protein
MAVTRVVDASGYVSFAGTNYRVGNAWRRRSAQVCLVAGSVQLSIDGSSGSGCAGRDGVKPAPINERLHLRRAGAAGLRMTPSSRAAVRGEGVSQGLFDGCGVHAEGVGDLAAVDDEGLLELVLHLR